MRILSFVFALCALAFVAPFAGAQTGASVKVASAGTASDIGFFLAHKKGYFREEGLSVELTQLVGRGG